MKKILTTLFFFVLLTCLPQISDSKAIADGQAILSFDELQYDFGKVKQGETLEHLFKFKNTGNATLVIQAVQPACGCTGVTIGDKKEFRPGESGEIKISFSTEGREGINSKTVSVTSNDKNEPVKTLSFVCEILNQ